MEKNKKASLSWFVISTREYVASHDWFWDKKNHCCYGVPKDERTDSISADIAKCYWRLNQPEAYYEDCVLMPELQELDILDAAAFLREWCDSNQIIYKDDLDQYQEIEYGYWGMD